MDQINIGELIDQWQAEHEHLNDGTPESLVAFLESVTGKPVTVLGCTDKVRYGHVESGQKAAEVMAEKTGQKFDCYSCRFCKGFHVGHHRADA